jgi:hypothetical protein
MELARRSPPSWYLKPYGKDPSAWDEAVRQCRRVLVDWARRGKPHTYSELVEEISALSWPEGAYTHHGNQVGALLGHVSVGEWLAGRPLLSAIVIQSDGGRPGTGFFDLARELGELKFTGEDAELRYWLSEFDRCIRYSWPDST